MRIIEMAPRLSAFVSLGWIAAPAAGTPVLMSCANCMIPGSTGFAATAGGDSTVHPRKIYAREIYGDLFHAFSPAGKGSTTHVAEHVFGSALGGLTFSATRRVTKRSYARDRIGSQREKQSLAIVSLGYSSLVSDDDALSIGLNGSFEKRRFALDLSNGHMSRGKSVGIEGAWNHGPGWRLAAGYRSDMAHSGPSLLVRSIEIAESAARTQHGAWATIGFAPKAQTAERDLNFGIKMQMMQLSDRDRLALGATSPHDNRIALTTSMRFR